MVTTTSTYVHFPAVVQVRANVQTALEALGVTTGSNFNAQLDGEVLREVQDILKPIKDKTWPSGRPENN